MLAAHPALSTLLMLCASIDGGRSDLRLGLHLEISIGSVNELPLY